MRRRGTRRQFFVLAIDSDLRADECYRCRGRRGYSRLIEFAIVFRSREAARSARRPTERVVALEPHFFRQLRFTSRTRKERESLHSLLSWS